jgi:hypothetical protein
MSGPGEMVGDVLRLPNPYAVPVVSVEVAGQLLGTSRATAYRWAAAGDLPTITFNGSLRVPVAALYVLLCLPLPGPVVRPLVDH